LIKLAHGAAAAFVSNLCGASRDRLVTISVGEGS